MSIADELRAAIRRDGRTLNALAEASGVDVGQLSRFTRGERDVTVATADVIVKALGLDARLVPPRKGRK